MIKRLLTPGLIPELARRRCVLDKNTLHLFLLWSSRLTVVEARPDERLANRTPKVLCVAGVVRQTQNPG